MSYVSVNAVHLFRICFFRHSGLFRFYLYYTTGDHNYHLAFQYIVINTKCRVSCKQIYTCVQNVSCSVEHKSSLCVQNNHQCILTNKVLYTPLHAPSLRYLPLSSLICACFSRVIYYIYHFSLKFLILFFFTDMLSL